MLFTAFFTLHEYLGQKGMLKIANEASYKPLTSQSFCRCFEIVLWPLETPGTNSHALGTTIMFRNTLTNYKYRERIKDIQGTFSLFQRRGNTKKERRVIQKESKFQYIKQLRR